MCSSHLSRFLCTRRHPAYLSIVPVPIFHPIIEGYKLFGRLNQHDTDILPVHRNAEKGVGNAMPCHRTGHDRHNIRTLATEIHLRERKNQRQRKEEKKKKKTKKTKTLEKTIRTAGQDQRRTQDSSTSSWSQIQ